MATSTATSAQPVPTPRITAESLRPIRVVLTYAVLFIFAAAMILPFVYSLTNSFKTAEDFNDNPQSFLPSPPQPTAATAAQAERVKYGWSTAGYERMLNPTQANFARALINSILVAVLVTTGRLILCSMAGYALARIKFEGRGVVFAMLIGTLMIPAIVLLIPRFLIFRTLNMVDTYQALILPSLADAFGVFLMKQFFESIPGEIEEAAEIDGSSRMRLFFTIILPMAVPALTALAIFSFQGSWNDFTGPLIATTGANKDLYTLPLAMALARGNSGENLQWDLLLPSAVMTTVPMALIFFAFQRFFVEGVSYTGVKG